MVSTVKEALQPKSSKTQQKEQQKQQQAKVVADKAKAVDSKPVDKTEQAADAKKPDQKETKKYVFNEESAMQWDNSVPQ